MSHIFRYFKKLMNPFLFALFVSILSNCEKEKILEEPVITGVTSIANKSAGLVLTHSDSLVISKMPFYYNFLNTMKDSGYTFYDFRTYMETDSDLLPEKLIVIRHDVHSRDVKWAYIAFQIEQIVIGAEHSSFYVMLNDPMEVQQTGSATQKIYLDLIHYLDSNNADVQPHISPVDLYICKEHPGWENYTVDKLNEIFSHNYFWGMYKDSRQMNIRGEDVLDMKSMNARIKSLLVEYNLEWKKQTGLEVQGYAAHGSATPINKVVNNAYLLDQWKLKNSGIFEYDTYNSEIFTVLTYLSDNSLPTWMRTPEKIQPGRYQFLMHPYQWSFLR